LCKLGGREKALDLFFETLDTLLLRLSRNVQMRAHNNDRGLWRIECNNVYPLLQTTILTRKNIDERMKEEEKKKSERYKKKKKRKEKKQTKKKKKKKVSM
jgi:hypothetical protein